MRFDPGESTKPQGIILSGAFVGSEILAEYGELPPCFLPLGQKRLFQHQVEKLRPFVETITLTLPEEFDIPASDEAWLLANEVRVLRVPVGLTLGESASYAIILSQVMGGLILLHGDTLLPELTGINSDEVFVSAEQGSYAWDRISAGESDRVIAGLFSFSDGQRFLSCLEMTGRNFVQAVTRYGDGTDLKSVPTGEWLDFGHLQNLYKARQYVTTERKFNSIEFSGRKVIKSGTNTSKLESEANWFLNLPQDMRVYTPPFLGLHQNGYQLGYEVNPNLHDLFIFGEFRKQVWEAVSRACFEFLEECHREGPLAPKNTLVTLTSEKTVSRLEQYADSAGVALEVEWTINGLKTPSLLDIISLTSKAIEAGPRIPGVMHGDFCFTNIFYDFRQRLVRVVDPRGEVFEGEATIWGDLLYDMAKLNHSIFGYDQILAGRFAAAHTGPNEIDFELHHHSASDQVQGLFAEGEIESQRITSESVRAITIQLFLSMLPLHSDRPDRQLAFIANALRLYNIWFS